MINITEEMKKSRQSKIEAIESDIDKRILRAVKMGNIVVISLVIKNMNLTNLSMKKSAKSMRMQDTKLYPLAILVVYGKEQKIFVGKEELKMRTVEEIKDYLFINSLEDKDMVDNLVKTAQEIEAQYPQVQNGIYGYGLECDFDCSPFILEDEDETEIKEIKRINGIVLYEICDKEE